MATGVSLPYGRLLLDYIYSYNDYLSTLDNNGYQWRSSGDSETHRLNASWLLFRNGEMKTSAMAGVSHYTSHNRLDDILIQSASRRLSSLLMGVSHTRKFAGGVATLNPVYTQGMPWFGAEDDSGKGQDAPKAEFRKWSVSGSFQKPLSGRMVWLTSAYGQWSPDTLYGNERLTLGGEASVRGFKEQYLSGDNGGYWRNELSYTLFTLPVLGDISAVTAIDGGWLRDDSPDHYASGTLWGAAAGLNSTSRHLSSQFTVGTPLHYPDWMGPDHVIFYYRLTAAF